MNDVIKLKDGTLIDTKSGKRVTKQTEVEKAMTAVVAATPAAEFNVSRRRYLDELPAKPELMNPLAVILMYRMFGLHDDDIAYLVSVDVERIQMLADTPEYTKLREVILTNVREFDQDIVRKTLNKNAILAAQSIANVLSNDEASIGEQLSAAKDILDRTGNRPVDVVEHRHSVNGGLVIRVVKQANAVDLPTIDMEPVN